MVAVTLTAVALAIMVPLLRESREHRGRRECGYHLMNITLGLQNYHDTYRVFPAGALHSGIPPTQQPPVDVALGPSWWYGIIPFMESGRFCGLIAATQRPGGPAKREFTANDMGAAGVPIAQYVPDYLRCPTSPLPPMETATGPILLPTYVGIAGGCDIDPDADDYQAVRGISSQFVPTLATRPYRNAAKGTGATPGSIVTSSGMLPPCLPVELATCLDGTANTMIVAEQSDWLRDLNPASSRKYHGDPGWTVGGTGAGGGFLTGTRRFDPVPQVARPGGSPSPWGADCWNINVVRYPPNLNRVIGSPSLPGCSENHGINNPLQSAHRGGVTVGMTDGSIRFLSDTTDLAALLRMAIRDDGQSQAFAPPSTSGQKF